MHLNNADRFSCVDEPGTRQGRRGWQPKRRFLDDSTIEIGKFHVDRIHSECGRARLTLDYRSHNPPWDPTRYLYDELVLVDQDLILGRAYVQAGAIRMPIAYFVLFRGQSIACDELLD